jgi:hypothetical protein
MAGAGKSNLLTVPAPSRVPSRQERKMAQKLREASLARVSEVRGRPGRKMAIPLKSAKRSRAVRDARARGDGPGMTNPHGYEDFTPVR